MHSCAKLVTLEYHKIFSAKSNDRKRKFILLMAEHIGHIGQIYFGYIHPLTQPPFYPILEHGPSCDF